MTVTSTMASERRRKAIPGAACLGVILGMSAFLGLLVLGTPAAYG